MIPKTTPVLEAYQLMINEGIRRLPVVEDDRVVGMVTLGDLREARPSHAACQSLSEHVYTVREYTGLRQ